MLLHTAKYFLGSEMMKQSTENRLSSNTYVPASIVLMTLIASRATASDLGSA